MSNPDLWGTPPWKRPIRGSYERSDYAGPGRFGSREAGSTLALMTFLQPVMLGVAGFVDHLATQSDPTLMTGAAGGSLYLGVMLWCAIQKGIAAVLRSHGASLVRDFGAWLWSILVETFWPFDGWKRRAKRQERRDSRRGRRRRWLWRRKRLVRDHEFAAVDQERQAERERYYRATYPHYQTQRGQVAKPPTRGARRNG